MTRILTIDAHPLLRMGLRLVLQESAESCSISEAGTGREGIAMARAAEQLSNGINQNVTTVAAWTTGAGAIATVNTGLVGCQSPGTTSITATYSGRSASVPVTVTAGPTPPPPPPTTGVVTVTGPTCTSTGTTAQLQAFLDGSQNVTNQAAWSSANTGVAGVSATGLLSCSGPGTTTITAALPPHQPGTIPVTVTNTPTPPQRTLIGIEVTLDANVQGTGSTLNLNLTTLLGDSLLDLHVFALYSDNTKDDVTSAAVLSSDNPLLRVDTPGVLNATGVVQALVAGPCRQRAIRGFTVLVNVHINTPVLGSLPIASLQLPSVASLTVGTKLPNVTAILSDGVGGTVELLVPSGTAGLTWDVRGVNYVPILGAILGATVNGVLNPLGNLVGGMLNVTGGTVQSINVGPIASIASLLGGVLQVDVRCVANAVTSNSVTSVIPLSLP